MREKHYKIATLLTKFLGCSIGSLRWIQILDSFPVAAEYHAFRVASDACHANLHAIAVDDHGAFDIFLEQCACAVVVARQDLVVGLVIHLCQRFYAIVKLMVAHSAGFKTLLVHCQDFKLAIVDVEIWRTLHHVACINIYQ